MLYSRLDEWVGRGGGVLGRRAWGVLWACGGVRWVCVGYVWGVCGACAGRVLGVCGACAGLVWGAISVGIARSALLSVYLGKSGHLPRLFSSSFDTYVRVKGP